MQRAKIYVIEKRPSSDYVWKLIGPDARSLRMFGFPVYVRAVSAAYGKFLFFFFFFYRQSVLYPRRILHAQAEVESFISERGLRISISRACYFKKEGCSPVTRTLKTVDRFRRRRSRHWKRSTRRILTKIVTDEHINENIIRNKSDEYWYSNVSKKTPRERFFFFLFIDTNYPTVFFVGDVWAQRKYHANSQFDFYYVYRLPLGLITSLIFLSHYFFAYAFLRVSSSFHPVSFYTITHAFTRAPSCRGLENQIRIASQSSSIVDRYPSRDIIPSIGINSRTLTVNFR